MVSHHRIPGCFHLSIFGGTSMESSSLKSMKLRKHMPATILRRRAKSFLNPLAP